MTYPQALAHTPSGTTITDVEVMSPAFTKYHLSDGRALHHFTAEEPDADPHDHPFAFTSHVLTGGYVEEVFTVEADGSWSSERVFRAPGTVHEIAAEHIHRIVGLPAGDCWTLVLAGPVERETRFWRFGERVESRAWDRAEWG